MLGVLSAQSADESASFGPRDRPQCYHCCNQPWGALAPEEPPSFAVGTASPILSRRVVPSSISKLGQRLRVQSRERLEPGRHERREGACYIRGPAILDDRFEFRAHLQRNFDGVGACLSGRPD